jgi:hypothetical protein
VLDDARRRVVCSRCPEIEMRGGLPTMTYPDTTGAGRPGRTLVLRDGRWRPV